VSLQGPDFRKYSRSGFSKVNYWATATSLYAFSLSIDTDSGHLANASFARVMAGDAQSGDFPPRYGRSQRFDTMPSNPNC
jgi:hypothetical protein